MVFDRLCTQHDHNINMKLDQKVRDSNLRFNMLGCLQALGCPLFVVLFCFFHLFPSSFTPFFHSCGPISSSLGTYQPHNIERKE